MAITYVTQEMPSNIEDIMAKAERQAAYNARHVVFRSHLYKCRFGDQLPRGKFFKGKKPKVVIMDEFHSGFSDAELTIIENSK